MKHRITFTVENFTERGSDLDVVFDKENLALHVPWTGGGSEEKSMAVTRLIAPRLVARRDLLFPRRARPLVATRAQKWFRGQVRSGTAGCRHVFPKCASRWPDRGRCRSILS